jgi:N4-(beta-N-acetylglucosaminyl)-L-asparaginase
MMRFSPSFLAVELMRGGMDPTKAAEVPIRRIAKYYPQYQGAIVCINASGAIGAAGHGWTFVYAWASATSGGVQTVSVPPVSACDLDSLGRCAT